MSATLTKFYLRALVLALASVGTANGTNLDLSAYRGKVVYLDFWASWCTPCRRSFPWLNSLVHRYANRDLVVIGINVDQELSLAEQFLNDTPGDFPMVYDPHGDIATTFKVTGMPSAVLIDRTGKIRFQHVGFSEKREEEYETHVRNLLAEPAH